MKKRILIVGDLHGNKPNVYFGDFDAIIAPGDFCSSDETRKYMFEVIKKKQKNPKFDLKWYELVGKERAEEMIQDSLKKGREILEFLNSYGVPVYLVPGNNDWTAEEDSDWDYLKQDHYKTLTEGLENIIDLHHKRHDIGDFELIGYGLSFGPEIAQYEEDKRMLKPDKIEKMQKNYEKHTEVLSKLFEDASKPVIFLSHNVPFNTSIDEITNKESPRCGYHYGSLITREMIDKYQPVLCIGGHMHEHFDRDDIKETTAVNTGFGSDVNILLELDDGEIKLDFYKKDV